MKILQSIGILGLCAGLHLSCSSEEEGAKEARSVPGETGAVREGERAKSISDERERGEYALRIRPVTAYANSVFTVYPKNFSLADSRIEWLVNGEIDPSGSGREFRPGSLYKGNTVQARAILDDGIVHSDTLTVRNSLPVISKARLLPEAFRPGDTLSIEPEISDADGDEVTVSYAWTLNGEPAGSEQQSIGMEVRRGDRVTVTITPYDGEDYGRAATVERTIQNMPPMIAEDSSFTFDGRIYSFQVRATDPDGDPLTYSIKSPPEGMSIDPRTGDVIWNVPPDFIGEVPITVAVSDGVRGESTRELILRIEEPKTEPKEIKSRED